MSSNDDDHLELEFTERDIEALRKARESGVLSTDAFIRFIAEMPKPDLRARRTATPDDVPFSLSDERDGA